MPDAERLAHRLAPDGTYQPVHNLASIHHEVDDSVYDQDRPMGHGPARGTGLFDGALEREREIAEEYLRLMGLAPRGAEEPAAAGPPEPADAGEQLRQLRERIARETSPAELAVLELYPEMDGHPEGGGGAAGEGGG